MINGFIKIYGGSKYLVLLGPEKYDTIYNRIRYLISLITSVFSRYFAKVKVDSYDSLPIEKKIGFTRKVKRAKFNKRNNVFLRSLTHYTMCLSKNSKRSISQIMNGFLV